MNNCEHARSLLAHVIGDSDPAVDAYASSGEPFAWHVLWLATADRLRQQLESGDFAGFEVGFRIVSDALRVCDALVREAAMPRLFGDFTRSAIAAGIDRARFVDWFGPAEILKAPVGRTRGRVLYFDGAKGRGKILASDGTVCFVSFSEVRDSGVRSFAGGQLVEFRPEFGISNGVSGFLARDVACLPETSGASAGSAAAG